MRSLVIVAVTLCACSRPEPQVARDTMLVEPLSGVRLGELVAGPGGPNQPITNPWANDKAALAEGRFLYTSFNCAGCHGEAGGGGIGPPLADNKWIYGSADASIYASIIQGRPNGMPAFGPQLTGEPVWKLAAYVRTLSKAARESADE